MMFTPLRFAIFLMAILCLLSVTDGRRVKRRPKAGQTTDTFPSSCGTNGECIQKGLPLLRPRAGRTRVRRQGQAFVPIADTTCGTAKSVFLQIGRYQVAISGAGGSGNGRSGTVISFGGSGATIVANFDVASNVTAGYFLGCPGTAVDGVGGGGGGSFIYLPNLSEH